MQVYRPLLSRWEALTLRGAEATKIGKKSGERPLSSLLNALAQRRSTGGNNEIEASQHNRRNGLETGSIATPGIGACRSGLYV